MTSLVTSWHETINGSEWLSPPEGQCGSLVRSESVKPVGWQRWFPTKKRQYGLLLGVVCVTALGSGVLFSFAGLTQQNVRYKSHDEGIPTAVKDEERIYDIKRAFEGNSRSQYAPAELSPATDAKLLCRFTSSYREGVYPYGVCTHFIYASVPNHPSAENRRHKDVLYSYDPNAFRKFLHVRETASDVRLLLSVDVEAMLRTGWSAQRLAKDARVWLDRSGVDGLHLSGLDLLPRSIHSLLGIITALRASFKDRYLITIGVDRTQKTVEQDLLAILRTVDFASFQTSRVRHTDARTTLVNPYEKYENSTSTFFFNYEVERLAQLAAKEPKSRVCFTLTLGGSQFELEDATQHGLGAPAKHRKDVSYSEICKRDWDEVKYIAPALGFYAHKGKTWVGYDTEKTIASKVRKALERYPGFCVMLVQVDRDDYEGTCSEKHFPLAQSVKQALLQHHRTRSR